MTTEAMPRDAADDLRARHQTCQLRQLSGAMASLERMVDALRDDIESGERTIRLITAAQAASAGF